MCMYKYIHVQIHVHVIGHVHVHIGIDVHVFLFTELKETMPDIGSDIKCSPELLLNSMALAFHTVRFLILNTQLVTARLTTQ